MADCLAVVAAGGIERRCARPGTQPHPLINRSAPIASKPAPTNDLLGSRLMLLDQVYKALGQGRVVFVEVVQGEGGVIPADLDWLRGLRRITERAAVIVGVWHELHAVVEQRLQGAVIGLGQKALFAQAVEGGDSSA